MNNQHIWKVGLIGLGRAAKTIHLPALAKQKNVQIVGGVDQVVLADEFNFPVFSSAQELLSRTQPDIAIIATPPSSHFHLTSECLNAGCHVFCEKPFVETVDRAKTLMDLARSRDRHIVINQEFRFMSAHRAAKDKIGQPEFGDLQFVSMSQTFRSSAETEAGWRGDARRRTGIEFGIHAIDLCRYYFEEDPISIRALMPKPANADGPDMLNLIQLEFSGDRYASITLDRLTRGRHRYLDTRLTGTKGSIETTIGGLAMVSAGVRGGGTGPFLNFERRASASARLYSAESFRTIARDPADIFPTATASLIEEMLSAIQNGKIPPCSVEDNLGTLFLTNAAYESAENSGQVVLSPFGGDKVG